MDKQYFRNTSLMKLKAMSNEDKRMTEKKLTDHLLASKFWQQAKIIGITISQGFEWDTTGIIKAAWEQKKHICVPKCIPEKRKLIFYQLDTFDQLEVGYHQLMEPIPDASKEITKKRIELLLVPGILFDKSGLRIGFGGGYYDRYLVGFPNETVSLCSSSQIVDQLPADSFDIPVQHIITENGIYKSLSS